MGVVAVGLTVRSVGVTTVDRGDTAVDVTANVRLMESDSINASSKRRGFFREGTAQSS